MTFYTIKMFNILFIDYYCYAYVKLAIVIGRVRVQIYQSVCLSVCLVCLSACMSVCLSVKEHLLKTSTLIQKRLHIALRVQDMVVEEKL